MSRGRGTKWLNENLSPLRRYLRSQVGRPWDAVYSEISERLRPRNAVQQHVRDHLRDFVAVHSWVENGTPVVQGHWGQPVQVSEAGAPRFYVCPHTGRLREGARRRRRPEVIRDPDVRWDGPWRQLRRVESIWYAFHLAPIPPSLHEQREARDRLLGTALVGSVAGRPVRDHLADAYGRSGVYAAKKRQLAKRELRRIDRLPRALRRGT